VATAAAPELDRAGLMPVVARALGLSVDALGAWTVTPLGYTVFNPVSQGIYRVGGTASARGTTHSWSAVLKVCRAPTEDELENATSDRRAMLLDTLRWDREGRAYASGMLDALPDGLAAPRCFGVEPHSGTLWIWLEDVGDDEAAWDVARYALAARHLGRLGGEYLAGRELPRDEWLSHDWIRSWSEYFSRTMPAILESDDVWAQPVVTELFDRHARDELRQLWAGRDRWWRALDRLPLTLSHLDAFRANLMSRSSQGRVETVAIDWAFVGIAPIAADVATLVAASLFYHGDPQDPADLTAACLDATDSGLRDTGYRIARADLERAYAINVIARWAFVIGPLRAAGDRIREEKMEQMLRRPYREIVRLIAERARYVCSLSRGVALD
jgi:Phosphotransferase enzyme family